MGSTPEILAMEERAHAFGQAVSPGKATSLTGSGEQMALEHQMTALLERESLKSREGLSLVGRRNRNNTSSQLLRSFTYKST